MAKGYEHTDKKITFSHYLRAHTLYCTVDDSSDELESGPTKKDHSFFFLLRHDMNLPSKYKLFH